MIRAVTALLVLAAAARPANGGESKRAIVVPTELGGLFTNRAQWRREFNVAIEDRLKVARFALLRAESLSPSEAECREVACLGAIASSRSADLAIAARVINDQQLLTSYHLRVRIAERQSGGVMAGREREKTCTNCSEGQARDLLLTLLSATLANEPERPSPPPIDAAGNRRNAGVTPAQPENGAPAMQPPFSPPPPSKDRFSHRQRLILRGLGIGVGALGLIGTAQGFVEVARDGDQVVQNGQIYRQDTTSGQIVFFTLGCAGVVAGGVLALLGWWPPKAAGKVAITPAISATGAYLLWNATF